MINEIKLSAKKLRSEHSDSLAIALDISDNMISAVYYDLRLKRRYARAVAFGIEIKPDNVLEVLIRHVVSSMRELSISSVVVGSVGIAASFAVSEKLENELSPSDFFLNPDTEIYFVPFISAAVGGRFTASLLTLPEEDCLSADFGRTLCIAEKEGDMIRCVAFPLMGAFDGSGYESGMPPENGAIDYIHCENDGTLVYEVVGDCPSLGVSPGGAAASVSIMLDKGVIDSDGIMTDRDLFAIGEDFFVSQNDVRIFQSDKAKAASAISLFSNKNKFFLSGEIFSSDNGLKLLTDLGAVPADAKAAFCRNSVEQGVILCLENTKMREKADFIAKNARDVSAELYPEYDKKYFDQLIFEKKCEN